MAMMLKRPLRYSVAFVAAIMLLSISCKKYSWPDGAVQKMDLPAAGRLNKVLCDSNNNVFVFGGENYYRSDFFTSLDKGKTWSVLHLPGWGKIGIYGAAITAKGLYASGFGGKAFYNPTFVDTNAWRIYETDLYHFFMRGIAFANPDKGFVVGNQGYGTGVIMFIDAAGQPMGNKTFDFALNDIDFADPQNGYAVGFGSIIKTGDGGTTWKELPITHDNYLAVFCINNNNVWAVGYNGTIVNIKNNGAQHEKIKNGENPFNNTDRYNDIAFKDAANGYICGDKGVMLRTTDGGKRWKKMKKFTSEDLLSIAIHPVRNELYVVGFKGAAYHITMP